MESKGSETIAGLPGEKNKPGSWRFPIYEEWKGEKRQKGGRISKDIPRRLNYQNPMAGFWK
jgi:hypothetical protein